MTTANSLIWKKRTLDYFCRSVAAFVVLFSTVAPCFAVDPPPANILRSPVEVQRQYLKNLGEESERLRSKVAERRFRQKQERRQAITVGLSKEVDIQRADMLAEGSVSLLTSAESDGLGTVAPLGKVSRSNQLLVVGVLVLVLYFVRDSLFRWWEAVVKRFQA